MGHWDRGRALLALCLLLSSLTWLASCNRTATRAHAQEPAGPPKPAAEAAPASPQHAASGQGPQPPAAEQAATPDPAAVPAEAAPSAEAATAPAPLPPAQPGNGQDGFTALQDGWPAAAEAAPAEPVQQELAPSMELTAEARDFAGRWTAAVINRDGGARLLETDDEWVFNLGLDGRCSARQRLDGAYWEQGGWWQLQGETLTLSLGPGGVWVFGLQRDGSDISIWSRAALEAEPPYTLFCIRTPETQMPPGLAGRYQSDFGPLRFVPTGPGHWRASYGEPAGKLTVARIGPFLAGTWEQTPSSGFVLFRLQSDGQRGGADSLDGVWWYGGSTSFDGRWRATAQR